MSGTTEIAKPPLRAGTVSSGLVSIMPFFAFLLALVAQRIVDQGSNLELGVAAYVVAAVIFVYAVWNQHIERSVGEPGTEKQTSLKLPLIVLAIVLAPVVYIESSENQFRPLGVLLWVASIALFLIGLPRSRKRIESTAALSASPRRRGIVIRWEYAALLAITLIGAFYRFYKLDGILAEMGTDLPLKYGNIELVLKGTYPVFFTSFPGRESLFFYFASIPAALFGLAFLTIKFSAAVVGTVTIPALFVMARRLFNTEVGLYASLLLAINHWHVTLSRIGYRAILIPLFVFILLYLFARAVDKRRDWDFALVGLWIGLGMYTYTSWLLAPFAFVLALLTYAIAKRNFPILLMLRFGIIAAIAAGLVWVPLGRYVSEQPDTYFGRVATRVTSEEQQLPRDVMGTFADNLKRTLAMFNYKGDSVFVVNVPYMREMEYVTAGLFILGAVFVLARWRRGYNMASLSIFLVMIIPSALSIAFPNEAPNSDRSSGGMAVAFLFAALPLALLRQHLADWLPAVRTGPFVLRIPIPPAQELRMRAGRMVLNTSWLVPAVALLLLSSDARSTFQTYFVDYANAQPYHNYPLSLSLAQAMDDFAGNGPVYIKYLPYWYDGNALRAQLLRTPRTWDNESDHFDVTGPPFENFQGRFMYILHPDDKEGLAFLQNAFPGGIWVDHYDSLGTVEFVSFYGAK